MISQNNIFIKKLKEKIKQKIKMYFSFLQYIVGKTYYNSIGEIIVFRNSEDIYPCYFFTPFSNVVKREELRVVLA